MASNETRQVTVKVESFKVERELPATRANQHAEIKKNLESLESLDREIQINLLSSGFEIQGLSDAKKGAHYPLVFTWTISPKKEGNHEMLLDLSNIVRDARNDSELIGLTVVRMNSNIASLKDGMVLPLTINVTGPLGVPNWIVSAGASIPGLLGFVLTYPLFVDWLRRKKKIRPCRR
jgi:hypothetical protein